MRDSAVRLRRGIGLAAVLTLAGLLTVAAHAQTAAPADDDSDDDKPNFPTTEFAEGAKSATVTVGAVTATVSLQKVPQVDPNGAVPVLTVTVGGKQVLSTPGVASGFDFAAAEASIAEIDPGNSLPEVYFTSYSGGAHCCNNVIVAEQQGDHWVTVPIGEFDGDGNYLDDIDNDGLAEIVTVDNRFLYQFDCYACSAAPLVVTTVRAGKAVDVTTDPRYLQAHRDWLKQLEENVDPGERWTSMGFLAGWVASKIRVGEGADAWKALNDHWNKAKDPGEQVCLTGGDLDACARKNRVRLKFPERLKLFLDHNGYAS